MTQAKTIMAMAGLDLAPAKLQDAVLLLIDMQNEYLEGPLRLACAEAALAEAEKLLAAARERGTPVIHIAHKGKSGSLFDREAMRGQIIASLSPAAGEMVIEKTFANSFNGTGLEAALRDLGRNEIILAGFMTHNCISSTARGAKDLGLRPTVVASASATRDLPDGKGGVISAKTLHEVALIELSDTIAIIAERAVGVL